MGIKQVLADRIVSAAGFEPRLLAARRLRLVLLGAPFLPVDSTEIADARDRALTNRLVTLALRRQGHLNHVIGQLLARGIPKRSGLFEAVLRVGLAELLFDGGDSDHAALFLAVEIAKSDSRAAHNHALLNAVLRNAQRRRTEFTNLAPALLFPDWLGTRWRRQFGPEAFEDFGQALLEGASLDLSVKPDFDLTRLAGKPVLDGCVRIEERDRAVSDLPGYADGGWWVQDVAASLAARTLRLDAGARVLDLCAAPGGKSAQLAVAGYDVTALDADAERLARLSTNMARLKLKVATVAQDAVSYRDRQGFDGVLVDAPCSATGTFRRHPEVIWNRSAADLKERAVLQRQIVDNAIVNLKPGGQLVYCTCSLEPEEGEHLAKALERPDSGLTPLPIRASEIGGFEEAITERGWIRTHPAMTLPGGAKRLDGFFVARFVRKN